MTQSHENFMKIALQEAQKAFSKDEIPIGAVVVVDNKIIAKGHNQTEALQDATAHAEMIALTAAFNSLGAKYLMNASIYVSVEPCVMCAGALYWSKIKKVIYGTSDQKYGFSQKCNHSILHPKTEIISGILAEESSQIMQDFFKLKRN